ncbi:hypothetical protein AGOR_G00225860 [Albula goreensis]|uniref:Uncharacterized protein n=1 Tax=Albula goreensis TaxID=1534307 RepID=A0A8T3CNU7_9TELE|nr:hypothetical protein AGOR_G00225860 [Albula goreensis]
MIQYEQTITGFLHLYAYNINQPISMLQETHPQRSFALWPEGVKAQNVWLRCHRVSDVTVLHGKAGK